MRSWKLLATLGKVLMGYEGVRSETIPSLDPFRIFSSQDINHRKFRKIVQYLIITRETSNFLRLKLLQFFKFYFCFAFS